MKSLFLVATCLISFNAFSKECSIFGVDHGPQSVKCNFGKFFKKIPMNVTCKDGNYFLKGTLIPKGINVVGGHGHSDKSELVIFFSNDEMELSLEFTEGKSKKMDAFLYFNNKFYNGTCRY